MMTSMQDLVNLTRLFDSAYEVRDDLNRTILDTPTSDLRTLLCDSRDIINRLADQVILEAHYGHEEIVH